MARWQWVKQWLEPVFNCIYVRAGRLELLVLLHGSDQHCRRSATRFWSVWVTCTCIRTCECSRSLQRCFIIYNYRLKRITRFLYCNISLQKVIRCPSQVLAWKQENFLVESGKDPFCNRICMMQIERMGNTLWQKVFHVLYILGCEMSQTVIS